MRPDALAERRDVRVTGPDTRVILAKNGIPQMTLHRAGKGKAAYLSGFTWSPEASRMLLDLLLYLTGRDGTGAGLCSAPAAEAAWFPESGKVMVMNNSAEALETKVTWPKGSRTVCLQPMETLFLEDD